MHFLNSHLHQAYNFIVFMLVFTTYMVFNKWILKQFPSFVQRLGHRDLANSPHITALVLLPEGRGILKFYKVSNFRFILPVVFAS